MACPKSPQTYSAEHLTVISKKDGCPSALVGADHTQYPAIPVQITPTTVELRDGSLGSPIPLPHLKKHTSSEIGSILFIKPNGDLARWDLAKKKGRYKLVVENGRLRMEEESVPEFFPIDGCEADCNEIDYKLGLKQISHVCPDGTVKQLFQAVKVPTCCCNPEDVPDQCCEDHVCATLDGDNMTLS